MILTLDEQIALAETAIAALEAMKAPDVWATKSPGDRRGIDRTLATYRKNLAALEAEKARTKES